MTTTSATAATTRKLRPGQVVRYHGSQRSCAGLMFRVNHRFDLEDGTVSYDLSEWWYGTQFSPADRVVLCGARPKSVTHVPSSDILARNCPDCGWEHWYLRSEDRGCPLADEH